MAWIKLGSTTLTSSNANIASGTITAKNFLFGLFNGITTVAHNSTFILNGDTGNNYAVRTNQNGETDSTLVNFADIRLDRNGVALNKFSVFYTVNISTQEKLVIAHTVSGMTVGAATAPYRWEIAGKHVNTSTQSTSLTIGNDASTYDIGSNLTAIGTTGGEVLVEPKITTGCEFHETDTNKDYVWNGSAWVYITP